MRNPDRDRLARALAALTGGLTGDTVILLVDRAEEALAQDIAGAIEQLGASVLIEPTAAPPVKAGGTDRVRFVIDLLHANAEAVDAIARRDALVGAGAGLIVATGIAPTMLRAGGPLDVDIDAIRHAAAALLGELAGVTTVRLTTPAGTDVRLDVAARRWVHDLEIGPGERGNLPFGEVFCAPIETSAEGWLVCDGTVSDLGAVNEPIRLRLRGGRIERIEGGDPAEARRLQDMVSIDPGASIVGELGFGINPNARFTGRILEDEKAAGSAHVAFGRNLSIPGGRNDSATHHDILVRTPTVEVTDAGGNVRVIMRHGEPLPPGL